MSEELKACAHCWHSTGTYLTVDPPLDVQVCCRCGLNRNERTGKREADPDHGPFHPLWNRRAAASLPDTDFANLGGITRSTPTTGYGVKFIAHRKHWHLTLNGVDRSDAEPCFKTVGEALDRADELNATSLPSSPTVPPLRNSPALQRSFDRLVKLATETGSGPVTIDHTDVKDLVLILGAISAFGLKDPDSPTAPPDDQRDAERWRTFIRHVHCGETDDGNLYIGVTDGAPEDCEYLTARQRDILNGDIPSPAVARSIARRWADSAKEVK